MSDSDKEKQKLDWKDYIAMIIALITTTLLPILIIIIILLVIVTILHVLTIFSSTFLLKLPF
jgi:uncharacterized membrane protein